MNHSDENNELSDLLDSQLTEAAQSAQPSAEAQQRMHSGLLQRVRASEPAGTHTIRSGAAHWAPFLEGIERKVLLPDDGSGIETALYRLAPGAVIPVHTHTHLEECWVVEGDVLVGEFPVYAGDMHIAYPGYEHAEILAPSGALLMIKSQVYTAVPADSP